MGGGVVTDVSAVLPMARACSTCYDYLTLGGANAAGHAILASYNITTSGELEYITSVTLPGTVANYCERCCCNSNPLLVATDSGLYATDAYNFDIVASNTSMQDNNWVNACWCCDNSLVYCSAINSAHHSYIFEKQGTNLVKLIDL